MLTDEYRAIMLCEITKVIPIPLQIGLILNIDIMPPLILAPMHIWNHKNGIPNIIDRIKNCNKKFAEITEKLI